MSENNLIGVFLYRSQNDGGSPLYGELREIQEISPWTIIGVATRPPGDTICSGGTRWEDKFADEVEEKAVQWTWLDTEMRT